MWLSSLALKLYTGILQQSTSIFFMDSIEQLLKDFFKSPDRVWNPDIFSFGFVRLCYFRLFFSRNYSQNKLFLSFITETLVKLSALHEHLHSVL